MSLASRLGWILFGFAAATLTAAFAIVPSANAQEAAPAQRRDVTAPSTARAPSSKTPAGDWTDAYEQAPSTSSRATAGEDTAGNGTDAAGAQEPAFGSEEAPASDPTAAASEGLSDEAADADRAADGRLISDGVVDLADPRVADDGIDPNQDTRPPADTDVFTNPPAGYYPLLFQIEDIDPVDTDRRPARLSRIEPYDPIGIKIGNFVLFPETEIGGLSTNNVLSSPDAHSDQAAEIRTKARLVSNWSQHALEMRGTIFNTYYDDFSSEDDRAWNAEARGRLDITRRTNLQGLVSRDVSQEQRSAIDANQIGPRADVTTDQAQLAFNHRFNRLSLQLRGAVSDTTYSETDGNDNDDRNTLETREAVRASWEFKPTFSLFAEQELNQREKDAAPADGIPRDSTGTRTRLGVDFGATGAILRGEVSLGYGRQSPDDSRLDAVEAMLIDANLAWRPTEITSFLLTARSDIFDTTTAGSGGVISRMVGLEARHAFRRYLIASAGLTYTDADYDSSSLEEHALTSFAGAEYYASPWLVLFTRYEHLSFNSSQVDADYDSDEIRVGVRIRR